MKRFFVGSTDATQQVAEVALENLELRAKVAGLEERLKKLDDKLCLEQETVGELRREVRRWENRVGDLLREVGTSVQKRFSKGLVTSALQKVLDRDHRCGFLHDTERCSCGTCRREELKRG